jgi:hypothetical protein
MFVEIGGVDEDGDEDEEAAPVLLDAEVTRGLVLAAVTPGEVEEVFVSVAVAAAVGLVDLEDGSVVAVEDAVESQETEGGRLVTPLVLQSFSAYRTAAAWSEGLQVLARQHAMLLRKPPFEQMHLISIL